MAVASEAGVAMMPRRCPVGAASAGGGEALRGFNELPHFRHHRAGGDCLARPHDAVGDRIRHAGHVQCKSEEHTSELQSLMRISYAVFCLKKKKQTQS